LILHLDWEVLCAIFSIAAFRKQLVNLEKKEENLWKGHNFFPQTQSESANLKNIAIGKSMKENQ